MTATTKTKTCPSWCDWQHHGNDSDTEGAHAHTVLGIKTGDDFAGVILETIGGEPPKVFVEVHGDMTLTPDEALRVAAAMIEAVRLAGVPTLTVREAAIENGWNPADGSPWVGPDGVTYPSKQAFYEAAEATR